MSVNPSLIFANKPVQSDKPNGMASLRAIDLEKFLIYYRQDLPGEIEIL